MDDKDLVHFASEFRRGLPGDRPSNMMCFAVSAPLVGLLNAAGIDTTLVETDLGDLNHFWIKLAEGSSFA